MNPPDILKIVVIALFAAMLLSATALSATALADTPHNAVSPAAIMLAAEQ